MNSYANPYTVAEAEPAVRAEFIKKTYTHLAGAIGAFILLTTVLMQIEAVRELGLMMTQGWRWLVVMGIFMVTSMAADKWAMNATSKKSQYMGLGLGVIAWSVIFVPMMVVADYYSQSVGGTDLKLKAAGITLLMVAGITAVAFVTKKDFSFMRGILVMGGFVAVGLIVASIIFGFDLGTIFAGAMVLFASASILYTTSNIIHHYREDQYVAASLALFAGIALLFWYVLRIVIAMASSD